MPLSPEQLALRRQGLGGSEIAAVAGIHPYLTAFEVYLEKIGLKEDKPNQYKDWGNRLEEALGLAYADKLVAAGGPPWDGVIERPGTIVSAAPGTSWMLATPDFQLYADEPRGLECKVRGVYDAHRWGPSDTDEVPDEVAAQCHWGMMVTGLKRWDVAVLLGGNDFRTYILRYDETIALRLKELGQAFWFDHVQIETPPTLDGTRAAQNFVKKVFPRHDDAMIAATPEHDDLCNELRIARKLARDAAAVKAMWEARVKAAIGDHAGILGRSYKVTWKKAKDGKATNWELVARGLLPRVDPETQKAMVSIQTNMVPGSRRLICRFPGEEDDDA